VHAARGIDQRRADQPRVPLAHGERDDGRRIGGQPGGQRVVDDDHAAFRQRGQQRRSGGLVHEDAEFDLVF
jgi:hypothetical protein